MIKYLLLLCTLALAACGGAPDVSESDVGSVNQAISQTFHMNVRMGTTVPTLAQDPGRNPIGLASDPNDNDTIVQGVQINKTLNAFDSGIYRTDPSPPRAFLSVQYAEYDALRLLINSAAAQGRQIVVTFVVSNVEQRLPQWPVTGTPTFGLVGVSPVTVFLNITPQWRVSTIATESQLVPDAANPTPAFTSGRIVKHGGFYEGFDTFTPSTQHAELVANDAVWNSFFSKVNNTAGNTRVQLTYESANGFVSKPLLGLPIFTLL